MTHTTGQAVRVSVSGGRAYELLGALDIARQVREEIEKLQREQAASRRASLGDYD